MLEKRFKIIGTVSACIGAFMLPLPVALIILGPAGLSGMDENSKGAAFVFRHMSAIAYGLGWLGLLLAFLLLAGGIAVYYLKPWGRGLIVSAVWLYTIYMLVFLASWVVTTPGMAGSDLVGRTIGIVITVIGLLFGGAMVFGLVVLARKLNRRWLVVQGEE
ncbi:MAG: hypothetical protein P8Z49_06130 [Acidobacteriota bacterium]|jgi:hypothetical protein